MKKMRIFAASPSDMATERAKIQTVAELLKPLAESLDIVIDVVDWSKVVPDMGRPEKVILDQLKPTVWDVFIGILWHRFGTPSGAQDSLTQKEYLSGTEEEFQIAYRLWNEYGKPRIMMYRCMRPIPRDVLDIDQFNRVNKFFAMFGANEPRGLYWSFETTNDFEKLLLDHLHKHLLDFGQQNVEKPIVTAKEQTGEIKRVEPPQTISLRNQRKEVAQIQTRLKERGFYTGPIDGYLGKVTDRAIRSYQLENNLKADGRVGPVTWASLFNESDAMTSVNQAEPPPTISPGSQRNEVVQIQTRLKELGFYTSSIDGFFGGETERAIRNYQRENNLVSDGIVGPITWASLFGSQDVQKSEKQVESPQPTLPHQTTLIHKAVSDKLSDEDRLGYKNLARTIADLIKNPATSVPLAIAIRGPWGSGKSSLMKMVQKILDPGYTETGGSESSTGSLQSFSSFLEALWGRPVWLGILSRFVKKVWYKLTLRPQKLVDTQEPNEPDRFTVWFNVWKYQTSEQVWAGLAHCIITQTTRRKNAMERAKFWLKLHAKRVDINRVERDAWGLVFRSGIITVGIALLLSVLLISAILFNWFPSYSQWFNWKTGSAGTGAFFLSAALWLWKRKNRFYEKLNSRFKDYMREPDYNKEMGFLHLVDSDIREVLNLVASKEKPLEVQPRTVAISRDHFCYPVIGHQRSLKLPGYSTGSAPVGC